MPAGLFRTSRIAILSIYIYVERVFDLTRCGAFEYQYFWNWLPELVHFASFLCVFYNLTVSMRLFF